MLSRHFLEVATYRCLYKENDLPYQKCYFEKNHICNPNYIPLGKQFSQWSFFIVLQFILQRPIIFSLLVNLLKYQIHIGTSTNPNCIAYLINLHKVGTLMKTIPINKRKTLLCPCQPSFCPIPVIVLRKGDHFSDIHSRRLILHHFELHINGTIMVHNILCLTLHHICEIIHDVGCIHSSWFFIIAQYSLYQYVTVYQFNFK